jgi:hypothetical protein
MPRHLPPHPHPPKKTAPVPIRALWRKEKSFASNEIQTLAHSQIAIPTTLLQLLLNMKSKLKIPNRK